MATLSIDAFSGRSDSPLMKVVSELTLQPALICLHP